MGITIRKKGRKWYLFVNYYGRRKAKCVGTRAAAEEVKRQLEAKFALGDVGFMKEASSATFETYATRWLDQQAKLELKRSTYRSYEQLLRIHVTPAFGQRRLSEITREQVKKFVAELSRAIKPALSENEPSRPRFSRNSMRLIVGALRSVKNAAVED